jgi:hypothetical protein
MTDFRALCQELMDAIDSGIPRGHIKQSPLAVRVDAALAQPKPQGPTDEELWDLYQDLGRDFSPTEFARTVLSRWGRPTIEPVPVSERLPGPEDCDAEGRCWWFSPPACGPNTIRPCWTFDSETLEGDTHWLPHWALPVPVVEGADG